jgi:hypothetical protein
MNEWFPRYSPDGRKLTSEQAPGKWQAQWLDNDTEIYQNGVNLVIGGTVTLFPAGSLVAAGGGKWASFIAAFPFTTYLSWRTPLIRGGLPAINPDGQFFYVDDFAASTKSLIWDGVGPVSTGAIADVRASRQLVVWSDAGRTWGYDLSGAYGYTRRMIHVAPAEFRPIPIDTPDIPWVLNHTHTGIILRPYNEHMGYRFDNGGQCFYPDAVWLDDHIEVAFTDSAGNLTRRPFFLNAPRIDLRVSAGPVEPPNPEPVPMPGITDSQFHTLETVRAKYGETLDDNEIGALLNEVAWIHRAEGVGMERKDGGTNATQPKTGIKVWRGMRFAGNIGQDVLGAASIGKCTPVRGSIGPADPATFVAPVQPDGVIIIEPPPPPSDGSVEDRLAELERRVKVLEGPRHGTFVLEAQP